VIIIGQQVLSIYRIEKILGQGAFGEVYLATHLGLNGKRAVKVLLRDEVGIGSTEYDEYRNRFRQESQLMEWFNHPNIIRVYDFQEENNTLFLVMEYASGGSLRERMDEKKKNGTFFTAEETVKTGIEIAEGLALLHSRDIVHRDLKPSNILFDAAGHAKVADLGLAQVPGGASMRSQLSVVKPHPGTPAYMSPEQEVAGSYLRPASDIYSLGLILFEMLTGRGYKSLRPGTRLKSLSPDSPDWLDDLLLRMLSDNPKDRPWDGKETLEELRRLHEARPLKPSPALEVRKNRSCSSNTGSNHPTSLESPTQPDRFGSSGQKSSSEKPIPIINNQFPGYGFPKKILWIILIMVGLIIGSLVLPQTTNDSAKQERIPSATIQPQNTIAAPTAVPINAKTMILGKWVVTEAIDDPVEQGPSWQQPGNTMEFFTNGNQEMIWDGMRSGTPYRVEGDIVYFTFEDGRSDGWKITFFNSGNAMTLRAMKTTEKMTLNRE
jgi:serine/threonine protein kinase